MSGWDTEVRVPEGPEMESDLDQVEWGLDQDLDLATVVGDCS